jgi:sugar phosphate permease
LNTTVRAAASKRWKYVLPIAFITYSFAYLDRSNYSIGAAGGLTHDLHITPAIAGLLGGLFFLGYFFFQIPAAHYAENKSVRKLISGSLVLWGIFAAAQGFLPSLPLLMADRFLLGVVEAAVIPAMLILLAHWFTARERGRANTVLILGNPVTVLWMSLVSGYLIQATSWRWMFVIEGIPAIVWALVFWMFVDDRPSQSRWLTAGEKDAVNAELAEEQRRLPAVGGYLQAFRKSNVMLLSIQYALWSIGIYGFIFWLPTIIKAASKQGIGNTGALTAVPYAVGIVLMLLNSHLSDRSARRNVFVWPWLFVGAVAFYISFAIGVGHFWWSYVLLIIAGAMMYAPYGPYFAIIPEFLPVNVSGAAMALINSFGALGGFVGTYIVGFLIGHTGRGPAFLFMACCLILAALLMLPIRTSRQAQHRVVNIHAA